MSKKYNFQFVAFTASKVKVGRCKLLSEAFLCNLLKTEKKTKNIFLLFNILNHAVVPITTQVQDTVTVNVVNFKIIAINMP